jgi:hypothetical protein
MKTTIMNTPDLHLRTYKLILSLFSSCLSEKEFARWNKEVILLMNVDTTQLSMKSAYELAVKQGLIKDGEPK